MSPCARVFLAAAVGPASRPSGGRSPRCYTTCWSSAASPATRLGRHFSNFGWSAAHDAALTRWMKERLQLAVWPKPGDFDFTLREPESALLLELKPPLNLQGVVTQWTAQVKAARAAMAEEASAWAARQR
jgi:hypothetical protein